MNRIWLLLLSALFLGLASFGIQFAASRPFVLDDAISEFATVPADFVVLDSPRSFGSFNSFRLNVRLVKVQVLATKHDVSARGELRGSFELENLATGGTYRCNLSLRPSSLAERSGFYGRCAGPPEQVVAPPNPNRLVSKVQDAFMTQLRGISGDARGLVAGLAIGDTTQLSASLVSNMKTVSLTHLTAVSGANCAIVLAMVYFLVAKFGGGKWPRLVFGLITLLAYVALVGAQPSVLRAAVMAGFVLVAISLGRRSSGLGALALSVLVLLIADPWLAVDFGFALSVAATAGLLILVEPLTNALRAHMPGWLALSFAVALAAQIFCLPILLQLQDGLSTYSLPANLLAEPFVAPITVLGILAVALAIPLPWLAGLLSYTASLGGAVIAWVADYFSSLPNETLNWPTGITGALAAMAVIGGFNLWFKTEPTKLRNLGITLLAMILAVSVGSLSYTQIKSAAWPMKNWQLVACDVGQGDGMVVRSEGQVAVIDVGRDDKPIDQCLSNLGIKKIDLLVLTHFDMDHVGGIRGALGGRIVTTALLSPFKDERWGATGTQQFLQTTGAQLVFAERGMTGTLGRFQWQVLSPDRQALGAEDSNDASIVMLWSCFEYSLLTMADIGERGQMRMAGKGSWWKSPSLQSQPLILKVSHHGSADQYPELLEHLAPDLSLISVGSNNSYGHPTQRTLGLLQKSGSKIARTDQLGSVAVSFENGGLVLANNG